MYLIVIAWLYVVLMMSVAEATNTTGTLLGAIVTFVLYGLLPMGIVVYIMGTPARKRKIKAQEQAELAAWQAQQAQAKSDGDSAAENPPPPSAQPHTGSQPPAST
jgi:hypothetical protein